MHCRNICYKHINAYFKHRQASMVNASILHKQTQVLSSSNEILAFYSSQYIYLETYSSGSQTETPFIELSMNTALHLSHFHFLHLYHRHNYLFLGTVAIGYREIDIS